METLFDIIGVGLFIIGIFSAVGVIFQFIAITIGSRTAGLGRAASAGVGFAFILLGAIWAGFLIWAGQALWGVTP